MNEMFSFLSYLCGYGAIVFFVIICIAMAIGGLIELKQRHELKKIPCGAVGIMAGIGFFFALVNLVALIAPNFRPSPGIQSDGFFYLCSSLALVFGFVIYLAVYSVWEKIEDKMWRRKLNAKL